MHLFYRASFLILITCSFLSSAFGQNEKDTEKDDVRVDHYLRKIKTDTLVFPGQPLRPEHFLIQFPDSIYNSTKIEIKKYIISGIRGIHGLVRSKDKTLTKVRFQVKGHRRARKFRDQLLKSLDMQKEQLEEAEHIIINGQQVNFRYDQSDRYHYFLFYLPQE